MHLQVLIISVSSAHNNIICELGIKLAIKEGRDFFGSFKSIFERHFNIHKNNFINFATIIR